ncbi:ABC transporter permease [Corynebacterium pyruviciproducens]|uniref:ABC transporter permease n=1 Tax=Corynebacterium pyruviciproducens TaxID=598660 RepID=UPI002549D9D7|nr:ABC transporter permease [Corynebacterium pyruviciproducens]MDK6565938.1 ABC transporter permease [Corynebacterium pyruviciproducens]
MQLRSEESYDGDASSGEKKASVTVDSSALRVLDVRPPLGEYFRQLWGRRFYILAESQAGVLRVDKDFRLGRLWLILQPLTDAAIYIVIFGIFLQTAKGIENFVGFVTIGIVFFGFINRLLLLGSGLLRTQKNMIVSFKFPRAAVPISKALNQIVECIPPAIVAVAVALLFQWQEPLHLTILLLPLVYILIMLFGAGLMLITARVTAFLPDVKPLLSLFSRFWLYGSGIFYSIDRFSNHEQLTTIMKSNPAYIYIQSVRDLAMGGDLPDVGSWIAMFAWALGIFAVGIVFFWNAEERYVLALQ